MADKTDLKTQRDRFLAFSFASADLFLELDEAGSVVYALGAAKSLTGVDHNMLSGHNWFDLFSRKDKAPLTNMRKNAREGERCGPVAVVMDQTLGGGRKAIVTGIKMPDSNHFYLTVGFPNAIIQKIADNLRDQADFELLDKDAFLYAAKEALDIARSIGEGAELTLLDIGNAADAKKRIGNELWGKFTETVEELLCSQSIDGLAAAEISEGRYSVIHDSSINTDTLRDRIHALSVEADPDRQGFEVEGKTVAADLQSLSERETMKALVYTINEFERKGTTLNIETLNSGFKAYVSANAQKVQQFKSMIEQMRFDFHFHPIVDLETKELSHFEMLSRFHGEGSTQEWVIFGEDIGMAADFDIAVCERAINYLLYKSSGHRTKFAINLSGQSIQNEQFFKTLMAKLTLNKDLANRMIFEITESTTITELDMVNSFIAALQKQGFKVCLDDFGAGGSAFQYLQQLHVDYVKIDGQYTQKILTSDREAVLVKNISKMCNDLGITVIAERIEKEAQRTVLLDMGIALGQGFLFAKPATKPQYDKNTPVKKASRA